MSKLDAFIQEKQQRSEEWKAQKTAERDELNAWSDNAILTATIDPNAYLHYLDVQADNPRYSASNILLAMEQNPEITYINSLQGWNALGRSVKREESGLKVRVSDPYIKDGRQHRGYKIGRVFDISQTTGKGTVPKLTVRENTPEMDTALRKLLDLSPVKIVTSTTTYEDARYDPASQEIMVSANLTDCQTFTALAREIVHAHIHNHGQYPYYVRNECALDADSVSYMLCHSFGIPTKQPDVSRIATSFNDMDAQDRRGILDSLQQLFRKMQGEIQREISPQERKQEQNRPVR